MSTPNLDDRIAAFLNGAPHAVVGASENRSKYGNKIFRCYLQHDRDVFPVNPKSKTIEQQQAYASLKEIPGPVHGVSIITPPSVTEDVIAEAVELGILNVWMQPGAESEAAVQRAQQAGMNVIAGDACLLVVLGYRDDWP